jgi:hypothetical protein
MLERTYARLLARQQIEFLPRAFTMFLHVAWLILKPPVAVNVTRSGNLYPNACRR